MARYYFQAQQRLFEYLGYMILIKEQYSPWSDTPGKPSFFHVYYVEKNKSAILMLIARLSLEQINADVFKYGVKFQVIENEGFFNKHTIDWAVEKAKELID